MASLNDRVKERRGGVLDEAGFQKKSQGFLDKLNPFATTDLKLPTYQSGARAFIRLGGKPLAVAQTFQWNVSYVATPIHSIDSLFPWDIDIGQVAIRGRIEQFMDPGESAESQLLFATMQSALHQPLVEMQVIDLLGTNVFFAGGFFLDLQSVIQKGALSLQSVGFIGTAYQHNVFQQFKPYSGVANTIGKYQKKAQKMVSKFTGGFA